MSDSGREWPSERIKPQPTALTDEVWDTLRDCVEAMSAAQLTSFGCLENAKRVLSRRAAEPQPAEPSPAPVPAPSGDVITAMCFAYEQALMRTKKDSCRESMTAAYNVARAHLTHKPVERVTVIREGAFESAVYLDGKRKCGGFVDPKDSERYAAGLRAELEKEADGAK